MELRLEHKTASVHRVWILHMDGPRLTIDTGELGEVGTRTEETFDTAVAAAARFKELVLRQVSLGFVRAADDPSKAAAPQNGWNAISQALTELYGDQEPRHWGVEVRHSQGGPDPLDGISAYDAGDHWHYITYGLSELFQETSSNLEKSGAGFELSMRVVKEADETEAPRWPWTLLQTLARRVRARGAFSPGHKFAMGGPLCPDPTSLLTCLLFRWDPELPERSTPHGSLGFLQILGLTNKERLAASSWNALAMADVVVGDTHAKGAIQPARSCIMERPEIVALVEAGRREDGSTTGLQLCEQLELRTLSDGTPRVVLAAQITGAVATILPGRTPFGRTYELRRGRTRVVLHRAEQVTVQATKDGTHIGVPDGVAHAIRRTLLPETGVYRFDGLVIEVIPTPILNARDEVYSVIGAPKPSAVTESMSIALARALLATHDIYPEACHEESVFDALQATARPGHVIEPLASNGDGSYAAGWTRPGESVPVIVHVDKTGESLIIAESPLRYLQYLAARWLPAWEAIHDYKPEDLVGLNALRADVGAPPYLPTSDAHHRALKRVPHLATGLEPYEHSSAELYLPAWAHGTFRPAFDLVQAQGRAAGVAEVRRLLQQGAGKPHELGVLAEFLVDAGAPDLAYGIHERLGDDWGKVRVMHDSLPADAAALAFRTVLAKWTGTPPDPYRMRDLPSVRLAYEERYRPWERLETPPGRTLAQLERTLELLDAWGGYPQTEARLRLRAARIALEMTRWEQAEHLLQSADFPDLQAEADALRAAIAAGAAEPRAEGLDALIAQLKAASDEERGPLSAELGLRMCLEGQTGDAYPHLEQAAMYLGYSHPLAALVMDVAEQVEGGTPLKDGLRERIVTALA